MGMTPSFFPPTTMSHSNNTNSDKDTARPSHQTLNLARLEQVWAEARAHLAQEEAAIEAAIQAAIQAEQKRMEEEHRKAEEARRLEQQRKEEREWKRRAEEV